MSCLTGAASFNYFQEFAKLLLLGEAKLFGFHPEPFDFEAGVRVMRQAASFQNLPECSKRIVEILLIMAVCEGFCALTARRLGNSSELGFVQFRPALQKCFDTVLAVTAALGCQGVVGFEVRFVESPSFCESANRRLGFAE